VAYSQSKCVKLCSQMYLFQECGKYYCLLWMVLSFLSILYKLIGFWSNYRVIFYVLAFLNIIFSVKTSLIIYILPSCPVLCTMGHYNFNKSNLLTTMVL
jgi:hypothetical protein